ncbi:hypothetical protein QZH41_010437 [Actinostola sp. cb2023]|nr:hypothetical protein QZH41_010437 [Actinostola sp. cb2023]
MLGFMWWSGESSTPPHNGFKPGMKLEVADPRVIKSTCLATVVGSIGPRIRCGFDGTDKSNDVWHMVDSTEIHPVGWCEANVGQLQPPVGFTNDPGRYQKFVATTLATAGVEKVAPARLFRKLDPSPLKYYCLSVADVSSPQVCSTSPVKTWSVDEVIKYLESTELADYVSLFKIHEIDGRALLLLNRDMIMSYMGLKLGPAIKLLNIVDDLKPQEIVEVE